MSDHKKIHSIIVERLKNASGIIVIDRLFSAWSSSRNLREDGRCGDDNLAAAEHYLYTRWYVADNGWAGWAYMNALIPGYEGIKMFGARKILPETGKCKVSPFDPKAVLWALQGTNEGFGDYLDGANTVRDIKLPKQRT
jgi:hypothetical protein